VSAPPFALTRVAPAAIRENPWILCGVTAYSGASHNGGMENTRTSQVNSGGEQRLLNVPELATYLKVSQAAIRKWLFEGKLPAVRLGKAVRFSLPEVMERFAVRR